MARYHVAIGSHPDQVKAAFHIQGPQDESQVPEAVKKLLDQDGTTQVDIRYDHGIGPRIEVYRKMPEGM